MHYNDFYKSRGGYTDLYFNTSTLWEAGRGQVAFYDKRHPVPFGEYVPDRAFFRPFAPELIDLIQREYTPGTTAPTLPVAGTRAGIAICFDIVDDGLMREEIRDGAQVIFAQTNNADFGRTDENPEVWQSPRTGQEGRLVDEDGALVAVEEAEVKAPRTHWDMLLERRTRAELEELLQERLELLRARRGAQKDGRGAA